MRFKIIVKETSKTNYFKALEDRVRKVWIDFRKNVINNLDLDFTEFKEKGFLKIYDDYFRHSQFTQMATLSITDFESYKIGRGVIEERELLNLQRFIPDEKYINESNRFSPSHCAWLYLAIGTDERKIQNTSRAECRAEKNRDFAFCEFRLTNKVGKIIDLTVADDGRVYKEKREYNNCKNALTDISTSIEMLHGNEYIRYKTDRCLSLLFANLISYQLFIPLEDEKNNKNDVYAPFHILAKYFISEGYDGIIYRSTVYPGGKNMVLFDKSLAKPVKIVEPGF